MWAPVTGRPRRAGPHIATRPLARPDRPPRRPRRCQRLYSVRESFARLREPRFSPSPVTGTALSRNEVRSTRWRINLRKPLKQRVNGEVDGHEFGQGTAQIYLYGPDAGKLLQAIRPVLRTASLRPNEAVLRFGDVDDEGCRIEVVPL